MSQNPTVEQSDYEAVHVFGERQQWAITSDDGCLRFHPQWSIAPGKTATHIWREAWEEVERFGGFESMRDYLRSLLPAL